MNLRTDMPITAAIVDAFRAEFGVKEINAQIRRALQEGAPTFYARENGREVGVKARPGRVEVSGDALVLESINPLRKEAARGR